MLWFLHSEILLKQLTYFEVFEIFLIILSILWILIEREMICAALEQEVSGPMIQFLL